MLHALWHIEARVWRQNIQNSIFWQDLGIETFKMAYFGKTGEETSKMAY